MMISFVLGRHTIRRGSINIARSMIQLRIEFAVYNANVSTHLVRRDSRLSQIADGFDPQENIARNRKVSVQATTMTMRVQLA